RGDFAIQPQMRFEVKSFDEVVVILLDLFTSGPHVLPVGLGRERVLVAVRRHVASQSGVTVPMPNTTNVGSLFQNGEVGEAGLPEDMSRGNPRHAGADDHDPRISAAGLGGGGWLMGVRHGRAPIAVIRVWT